MGVGQQNKIDIWRPVDFRIAISSFNSLVPLVHATVNTKAFSTGFYHVAGTGYRLGGPKKVNLHAFFLCVVGTAGPPVVSLLE